MGDITGDGTAVSGLGGPEGYGEVALPRGDTGFAQVDVSAVFEDGFIIDGVAYDGDELFISTDGFVTFGTGVDALPGNPASLTMPVIAPFMADIDTRLDGEGAESGQIWLDVDTVNDCVTITWDDVGFYRRNATFTNTFQVQLYDLGDGTMDVVFRYDSIEWTSGDLQGGSGGLGGTPALIGYRMDSSGALTFLGASGDQAGLLALPTTLGNTGVAGLYVFQMGDGALGDPVEGTAGNDTLAGTDGVDTLLGLGGNDVLFGSAGADVMDGGQGIDRVDFSSAPAAILLDMTKATANQGWAAGDSFLSVENVVGSGFDDVLTGLSNANLFDGGAGHDSLIGQGGDDTLLGQQGHDTLLGGTGNDRLEGSSGNDSGRGGDGDDSLFGGSGNDSLLADKGNDLIDGGDGNDTLAGSHGNDTLIGGKGNDLLQGQNEDDSLDGGAGDDMLQGHAGNDWLYGGDGNDNLRAGGGDDFIFGGAGDDICAADGGNDSVFGGGGKDSLYGAGGKDTLFGEAGQDLLRGDDGSDLLWGGDSDDTLMGGLGKDQFQHNATAAEGSDWVSDYDAASGDVLLLGIAGATADDFAVTYAQSGGGSRDEAYVTYLPTGQVLWILQDAEDTTEIVVQSSSSSFNLL